MEREVQADNFFQRLVNARFVFWFLSTLALLVLYFLSQYLLAQSLRGILATKTEVLTTQMKLNAFSELKLEKQRSLFYQEKLNTLFPEKEKLFVLVSSLEDQAHLENLQQFFSFGAESGGDANQAKNIGFNITLSGQLSDFLAYLKKVENLDVLLSFSGLDANSKSDGSFQVNGTGQIYLK